MKYSHYLTTAVTPEQKRRATLKGRIELNKSLTTINKKLNTTQIAQCGKDWSSIDFNTVTSATTRKQSLAFAYKDKKGNVRGKDDDRLKCSSRYTNHLNEIKAGSKTHKLHGRRLNVYELVQDAYELNASSPQEKIDTINLQWEDNTKNNKGLGNIIACSDTSYSMTADNNIPLYNSIGLGIRVSELTHSAFKDRLLTFAARPVWHNLTGCKTFIEKVQSVQKISTGLNTDFYAAMKMILDVILENEILNNIGFWTEGSIDIGKISGDSSSASKSIFGNSVTFGIDININDNYHLGFALGDNRDEIKIGSSGSNIDLHITTISSYHSLALSNTQYLDFLFGYGDIKVDTNRFYSSDSITYSGKRNGDQYFTSIGFNIVEEKNNYTINPFGRLDIGYGKLEHYTESTGTNALHYESVHLHQKNSALGIHLLRKAINGKALTFTPQATIEFGSDSSQSSKIITHYTSDSTTLYTTNISPTASAYFRQKISMDISSSNNLMINIF